VLVPLLLPAATDARMSGRERERERDREANRARERERCHRCNQEVNHHLRIKHGSREMGRGSQHAARYTLIVVYVRG